MNIKRLLLAVILTLFLSGNCFSQDTISTAKQTSGRGFNFALYLGPAFGNMQGDLSGNDKLTFQGTTFQIGFHGGVLIKKQAFGIAAGYNTLSVNKLLLNGAAVDPGELASADNIFFGVYYTTYFTPATIFASAAFGVGKITSTADDGTALGSTDLGMAWNVKAGKEWMIGKAKRYALGGYVNFSGISCKDQAPDNGDTYLYLGPGAGVAFSYFLSK